MVEDVVKNNRKVIGLKQSKRAILAGSALRVFIAEDSDGEIKESIIRLCAESNVPVGYVQTMRELGSACDIDVGAAVVTILKDSASAES